MNNVGEKYLPIGTVVMLKGGSKRVMITGFCSMPAEDNATMFDYAGCMYPEGFLSSDQTALFNHDQIETIYHLGLVDDEEKQFKTTLNAMLANMPGGAATAAPVAPVQPSTPAVAVQPTAPVEAPVPPVGPGLPGYVAPSAPVTQTTQPAANGYQFDANGQVIAAPTVLAQPTQQPEQAADQQPAVPNYKFDENGILISA